MPKGELVIHPTLWNRMFPDPRFGQLCPVCRKDVYPMTPIHFEPHGDGRFSIIHADCANPPKAPGEPEAI